MENITIVCVDNGNTKEAEVLERDDQYMKVHVPGTELFLEFFRKSTDIPYTSKKGGLTFEWEPKN